MKILIVGAKSFLGKQIFDLLMRTSGIKVWTTNRCNVEKCAHIFENLICVDNFGNKLSHQEIYFDTIYLLPTFYSKNSIDFEKIIKCNITFLVGIIKSFENSTKHFIYTNTYLSLPNPSADNVSLYAITKQLIAKLINDLVIHKEFIFSDVYLFDIIGRGDTRAKFLDSAFHRTMNNDKLNASPGKQLISPIHVYDAASALIKIANETKSKKWQLSGPRFCNLRELVDEFNQVMNIELNIKWGTVPYVGDEIFEIPEYYPNLTNMYKFRTLSEILQDIYLN